MVFLMTLAPAKTLIKYLWCNAVYALRVVQCGLGFRGSTCVAATCAIESCRCDVSGIPKGEPATGISRNAVVVFQKGCTSMRSPSLPSLPPRAIQRQTRPASTTSFSCMMGQVRIHSTGPWMLGSRTILGFRMWGLRSHSDTRRKQSNQNPNPRAPWFNGEFPKIGVPYGSFKGLP